MKSVSKISLLVSFRDLKKGSKQSFGVPYILFICIVVKISFDRILPKSSL